MILKILFASSALLYAVRGQKPSFQLPNLSRDPPKPQVPPDYANFFQLPDAGARKFIGSYLPGFIPPASFDVVDPYQQQQALLQSGQPVGVLTAGNRNSNNFGASSSFNGPLAPPPSASTNSFWSQLPESVQSLLNGQSSGAGSPAKVPAVNRPKGNSSISGIPNVFPSLPKAPIPQAASVLPTLPIRPEVPTGGLGPLQASSLNLPVLASQNVQPSLNTLSLLQGQTPTQFPNNGAYPFPQQSVGNENLLNQLLKSVGLGSLSQSLDLAPVNAILGLTPQQQSPQQNGLLSNVLYNALVDNQVQTQDNTGNGTNVIDSKANAALIQNLLTQPNSPFCNPKPTPVDKFNVDSFTGKWYQVLYSPPLSAGPCSMITYQKLADVGQGGPGTVFDTFEYTTEATPYGKPRISSGYGIVRGPGQLIYRTTNSPTDVNVFVLQTGPMNTDGQYEYIVLAVNCNYPLHVFARDPVVYKQKYENDVNAMLEKKGLVTSWSRLLNMVASVDYNLCTFPPSLFNVRG